MDGDTRNQALKKAQDIDYFIGLPSELYNDITMDNSISNLDINPNNHFSNMLNTQRFNFEQYLHDSTNDLLNYLHDTYTESNAYYHPADNNIGKYICNYYIHLNKITKIL